MMILTTQDSRAMVILWQAYPHGQNYNCPSKTACYTYHVTAELQCKSRQNYDYHTRLLLPPSPPPPKGGWGCLSPSCLESQGCHWVTLIPLYCLLAFSDLIFCLLQCPILLSSPVTVSAISFLPSGPFPWTFTRKFFNIFCWEIGFFVWLLIAARRSKLVGGVCSMLPYGTGICCYAFLSFFYYYYYWFCPFLFFTFFYILFKIWYW